jgi:predicted O-linked N-acetylglucosamine transferase (SPINDLY family)
MTDSPLATLLISAFARHRAGDAERAEHDLHEVLALDPRQPLALDLLALLALARGAPAEAIGFLERAVEAEPNAARGSLLGHVLAANERPEDALGALRAALELDPSLVDVRRALAATLARLGRLDEAIEAYRTVLDAAPDDGATLHELGDALQLGGRLPEAVEAYRRALAVAPRPETLANLGSAYKKAGALEDAEEAYRAALALDPNQPGLLSGMGSLRKARGELDEAISCFERASALRPDDASLASNRLYALLYHPAYGAHDLQRAHLAWGRRFADPRTPAHPRHANERSPERRLRIGYVSPNFRAHCQALFTIPLFGHHDASVVDVVCYSDASVEDATTERLRAHAATWRRITGRTDDDVAALVREDRIDVLVDLTMHMADNRLLAFARKPAPVQVSWLAYPGTTGVRAIDYRLSDPHLDPVTATDAELPYAEETLRLPETFWCYDPLTEGLEVGPLPAARQGAVTFGCLNNFCKIDDATLRLWARVLAAVPTSRLVVLAPRGAARDRTMRVLGAAGIAAERVEPVEPRPRRAYLELYQRIDVCLDTHPYNGHTTSLDALWMGVPVVTRVGDTVVGRAGLSQLANLGLTDLATHDEGDFVTVATRLATDRPRLAALRSSLRPRFDASPLRDAARFARNLEAAYRRMWHRWLARS